MPGVMAVGTTGLPENYQYQPPSQYTAANNWGVPRKGASAQLEAMSNAANAPFYQNQAAQQFAQSNQGQGFGFDKNYNLTNASTGATATIDPTTFQPTVSGGNAQNYQAYNQAQQAQQQSQSAQYQANLATGQVIPENILAHSVPQNASTDKNNWAQSENNAGTPVWNNVQTGQTQSSAPIFSNDTQNIYGNSLDRLNNQIVSNYQKQYKPLGQYEGASAPTSSHEAANTWLNKANQWY